jgi:hypothetical protein
MAEVSAMLPSTIVEALELSPISEMKKHVPEKNIEAFIAIELNKLASMFNGDSRLNLQPNQIPFIANALINEFKNENLADFVICFKRGLIGKYDEKLLRLDVHVIFQWMRKYLDEKYEALENKLMAEKTPKEDQNLLPVKTKESDFNGLEYWMKYNGFKEPKKDSSGEFAREAVLFQSKRKNWDVVVEDEAGNVIGKIESVYAESQEDANKMVEKLIKSGQIKL